MKNFLIIILFLIVSCDNKPISTEPSTNPEIPVSLLFNYDGCAVYRFIDSGRKHHFVKCIDGSQMVIDQHTETCGKGCANIIEENIQTIKVKK
jgi:hypothetical protein